MKDRIIELMDKNSSLKTGTHLSVCDKAAAAEAIESSFKTYLEEEGKSEAIGFAEWANGCGWDYFNSANMWENASYGENITSGKLFDKYLIYLKDKQ